MSRAHTPDHCDQPIDQSAARGDLFNNNVASPAHGQPDDAARISLRGVTYNYPRPVWERNAGTLVEHLHDINLDIEPGQVVLLCGASGSGKSTLLRAMNGLVPLFYEGELSGTVTVGGTNLAEVELHDMGHISSTVFQNPRTQFFTSTVKSEMAFTRENYGDEPHAILQAMEKAARDTGIEKFLDRQLDALSGGELQRVACACALCADVAVLLFDEPTSNLSPQGIENFRDLLKNLKQRGYTIVIAEHRIHFLKGLIDTVYRLEGGKIVEHISGEDFFALNNTQRLERGLRALTVPEIALPEPSGEGLCIKNLRFGYGSAPVLDIENLIFPEGAVTILAGENGAGKTTLAMLICGLLEANSEATFQFDGKNMSPRRRNRTCGMVMQDVRRQLFSESVEAEVTLGLSKEDAAKVDVDALLNTMELQEFCQRHPISLSGGQQQRLVIASTLAAHKRVVIFDEPTSGVDLRHLHRIACELKKLAAAGAVVIVVTHDPELIAECGEYMYVLEKLEKEGLGRTRELA
ncbi:MAG: ABC transporter ATP-binding protein [Actinomycetaceae bacterium]|nr:ABC transporter ATP-binding protein [Actinomycetaceae bacterium]